MARPKQVSTRRPHLPKKSPWEPPEWEKADAYALQALSRGDADEGMQKRALEFLIHNLCGTYDMSYRPDSDRDTTFAEGKRFVGGQIVKLLNINLSTMKKDDSNG